MDGELVRESPSKNGRGNGNTSRPLPKTFEQIFEELCPKYMVYGMTPDQFWNQDCHLAKYYREAYEMRRELDNEAAWWQGIYFSEAVSAALYGRKAKYPVEPHPLKTEISKQREEARQEQNERKVVDYFMTFTKQFNERFAKKQKEKGSAE